MTSPSSNKDFPKCSPPSPDLVEMRDKAYKLCRDYLSGAWRKVSKDDITFNPISGGLSNLLYYCALPKSVKPKHNEPTQVLLRMYGQIHEQGVEAVITQSVIFTLLSERRLGPKLYGVFPGGRLEEYITSRSLRTEELRDPEISSTIASKCAKVHRLEVPINKEPMWLTDTMNRWMKYIDEKVTLQTVPPGDIPKVHQINAFHLAKEYEWIKSVISNSNSPVVFSHNDLQEGNILINDSSPRIDEDWLCLIDFEYCSYNYRGFDLANHLCEWNYDYTNPSPPYFYANQAHHPSADQQLLFAQSYLFGLQNDVLNNNNSPARPNGLYSPVISPNAPSPSRGGAYSPVGSPPIGDLSLDGRERSPSIVTTEEALLKEIFDFILVSHFFWGLWSIVNAKMSQIKFGYWEYAMARFDAYFKHKELYLKEAESQKTPPRLVDGAQTPDFDLHKKSNSGFEKANGDQSRGSQI